MNKNILKCSVFIIYMLFGNNGLIGAPVLEPGFPVTLEGRIWSSSVVLADINGNGYQEIVVAGEENYVYCYNYQGVRLWRYDMVMPINGVPAVGDMNRDGLMEIVVGCGDQSDPTIGDLALLSNNGVELWKKQFRLPPSIAPGGNNGIWSSPAMVDLDLDEKLEVVVTSWNSRIYAFEYDGSPAWSNPYPNCGLSPNSIFTAETQYSSTAVGDIDMDGYPEVAIGLDINPTVPNSYWVPFYTDPDNRGALLVLNHDATLQMDFFTPNYDSDSGPCGTASNDNHIFDTITNWSIWAAPAIGDIDGDGRLEIVSGTGPCDPPLCSLAIKPPKVYAWNHDGSPVPGWPVSVPQHCFSSATLADITGDGIPEVIIGCDDEQVYAFRGNGTLVPGWPVRPTSPWGGAQIRTSPIVADVDGDNQPEILVSARWYVYVFERTGGVQVDGMTMTTGNDVAGSCAVGDIDNDGSVEVVAASGDYNNCGHTCGKLYVWDMGTPPADMQWPMFHQNAKNTGLYQNYNSELINRNIPSSMNAGTTYYTSITLKNNGILPWKDTDNIALYPLIVPDPLAVTTKVSLDPGETILPGQEKTFNITFRPIPGTLGLNLTKWQLKKGTTPFGDVAMKKIFVNAPSTPIDNNMKYLVLLLLLLSMLITYSKVNRNFFA